MDNFFDFIFSNQVPLLEHYILLSVIIFSIGVSGMLIKSKSIINILMSIELMLLAVNINFIAFSIFLSHIQGQIFAIFILTVAAAEAAIGLSILVIHFKNKVNVDIESLTEMKG